MGSSNCAKSASAVDAISSSKTCSYRRLFHRTMSKSLSSGILSKVLTAPWLMLPSPLRYKSTYLPFYTIAEDRVIHFQGHDSVYGKNVCVGSSHGWLAYMNTDHPDSPRGCSLFLVHPRYNQKPQIKMLPSAKTLPFIYECGTQFPGLVNMGTIDRLILSCEDVEDENCIALIVSKKGHLAFCWPAHDSAWTMLQDPHPPKQQYHRVMKCPKKYHRVISCPFKDGLFYALTPDLEIEVWDLINNNYPSSSSSPARYQINQEAMRWRGASYDSGEYAMTVQCAPPYGYLVPDPSSGEILLVARHVADGITKYGDIIPKSRNRSPNFPYLFPYKTMAFDVMKLDFTASELDQSPDDHDQDDDKKVVELQYLISLGDRALFIDRYHCIALPAVAAANDDDNAGCLKPNSIYFTDDGTWDNDRMVVGTHGGHDLGIYNYESQLVEPCYFPCDVKSIGRILPAPSWYFPSIRAFRGEH